MSSVPTTRVGDARRHDPPGSHDRTETRWWLSEVVAAQERIRAVGPRSGPLVEELLLTVSTLLDASARVALLDDGRLVCRAATADLRAGVGDTLPTDGTLCGTVLASGRARRVADLDAAAPDGPAATCCPGGRSALAVPLVHDGLSLGLVVLTAPEVARFDRTDEQTVMLLAGVAATILALRPQRRTPVTPPATSPGNPPFDDGATGTVRLTATGEGPTIHLRAGPRPDAAGALLGAAGAVADAAGRELDPALRRRSVSALRAAAELTGVGVWEWRPDDDRLTWSPQMFRIVGLRPGGVLPSLSWWHSRVHPDDVERVRRLDLHASEREGGSVETFRIESVDGQTRHVQSWSSIVPGTDGTPDTICGATVDVTPQVHDRVMLERMSATDPVTGLGNRVAFDRRMQEVLADPTRDVALILLDLDRFKLVNDSLGHQVGDRLLVEVAQRLAGVVPDGSTTVRMGGDEFVIVPRPGLGWLQVRRLAQAVVDTLRAPYVLPGTGEVMVSTASVGITSTSGRSVGVGDLLREADLALYRAKDCGRDRYVVFDDVLRSRAQARHEAEQMLRWALERARLVLEYQPIVDFRDGRVVGAEALVRLRGPQGGPLLPPDAFIDVAEDSGLVVEMDCWVIDTAIEQIGSWTRQTRGQAAPWLAINVSARSMEHPHVVRRILDAVRQGRVGVDRIKVELTEHSFLGATPGGESSLRQLLGSGVRVGIDDFGTGYSALAYLQRFDLDFMKIDKSFVADVGMDDRADAVVTAIIDLAHAHGMRVTAEGVETPRQARRLREMGCDLAQGWHFGRPGEASRILSGAMA